MELSETHVLPVPQARAWEALNDTEILKLCIPGCDSIDAEGENAYAVAMTAAVGPVKARFKGRMELTNIDAPKTYTIVFEGQGGAAGFSKGSATVNLEPGETADTTRLTYSANAQVGGKLAQIGSRLVDGAARKIAGEFFKRFSAQLQGASEPANESADAENGGDAGQEQGKKSWTAWISKS
ncbi:carbon monoxide dehydrogenase subunit G [Caballeronia sp. GAFFF2]|uniref:CoxG family protein n=1 Tax=Caballeronia sp. GAFFF2 TaxID=2921741 RepID=UPI002027E86F|nr:carbon monoxide dehydrogenase subunit G [Caballeronia sp. GAFFF2]